MTPVAKFEMSGTRIVVLGILADFLNAEADRAGASREDLLVRVIVEVF